jgi:hypothetical protein
MISRKSSRPNDPYLTGRRQPLRRNLSPSSPIHKPGPAMAGTRRQDHAGAAELLHLAEDRDAAERWLGQHHYSNVRLEDVTENEIGAGVVEGRAA